MFPWTVNFTSIVDIWFQLSLLPVKEIKTNKHRVHFGIFSANWEFFWSIGNFFSRLGKNLVPETGPSFVKRKSPEILPACLYFTKLDPGYGAFWSRGFVWWCHRAEAIRTTPLISKTFVPISGVIEETVVRIASATGID